MSRKHFSVLLAVAIAVLVGVALLVPRPTGRDEPVATDRALPGLEDRINDADRITVVSAAGPVVTLRRGDASWSIDEFDGYTADWDKVRKLLAGLAQARVLELKTSNEQYFDRLGVADLAGGGEGLLVTVAIAEDEYAVIVGRNAEGRDGRFLRPADSPQSLLSDFDAEVPDNAAQWANRRIADIAADQVAEVEISHADGGSILARKLSADESDFTLVNLPEGRELQSSWAVNSLGGVLSALDLESVKSAGEIDWEGATRLRLLTFSGLQVQAEAVVSGEEYWLRLDATAPFQDEEAASTDGDSSLAEQVEEFNRRVVGWAYRVPEYKYAAMSKRLSELLKPPGDEPASS